MAKTTILSSIEQICQEKKISHEQVLGAIEQALASAYRKDFGNKLQNLFVEFDPETGKMKIFDEKTVVEDLPKEPSSASEEAAEDKEEKKEQEKDKSENGEEKRRFNPKTEIQISEARQDSAWENLNKRARKIKVDDIIRQELEIPSDFGRIAAQTAKQVIIQRLREAERQTIFEKYESQVGTVINGTVQRKDRQTIFIDLLDATGIMPYYEQVPEEKYWPDQKIKVYVVSVNKTSKGPEIIVSRRHTDILRELFKLEIPEIANKTVEIKCIAREPGSRSKVAVWTSESSIDPIGAAIGQRGVRIQTIIGEIGGEKIDIIQYSDKPEEFIANALSPAKIFSLKINKKEKKAIAGVKKNQLSLAIGKAGQNVRLAAKLTGWKIDVTEDKTEEQKQEKEPDKKQTKKVKKKKKETTKAPDKKSKISNGAGKKEKKKTKEKKDKKKEPKKKKPKTKTTKEK